MTQAKEERQVTLQFRTTLELPRHGDGAGYIEHDVLVEADLTGPAAPRIVTVERPADPTRDRPAVDFTSSVPPAELARLERLACERAEDHGCAADRYAREFENLNQFYPAC